MSPKSREKVGTILRSATAFAAISGGKTNEPFLAEMNRVVLSRAQCLHGCERNTHVGKESHAARLLTKPISSYASADAYCSD